MKRNSRLLAGFALVTAVAVPAATAALPANSTPTNSSAAGSTPAAARTSAADAGSRAYDPVPALDRAAYPIRSTEPTGNLRDLRPLIRMVGPASVVGVGEATHNSREFFTLRHRIFRSLVEQQGFTTFALEGAWSTGVALDRYITTGVGDPREIMRREFQGSYQFWNVQEYLDLIEWMRDYNKANARKLHFVGDDLGYVGPELIDRVTAYVAKTRPAKLAEVKRQYAGIRSTAESGPWVQAYVEKPLAERVRLEAATRQVMATVAATRPSAERTWVLQHARATWQVAKFFSWDITGGTGIPAAAYKFRDHSMAANVAWWHRVTSAKIVIGAHNGHIAYKSSTPAQYPKIQGEYLREQLGRRYLNIGLSFDHGSFNSADTENPAAGVHEFTLGSAPAGNNEFTLDKVRYDDYLVDLRKLPRQTKQWLAVERLNRDIGSGYPFPDSPVALGKSYDLLIHLNEVTAADLLTD